MPAAAGAGRQAGGRHLPPMVSVFSWRSPEHAARACTEVHPARNLLQLAWAALRHHPPPHTHNTHNRAQSAGYLRVAARGDLHPARRRIRAHEVSHISNFKCECKCSCMRMQLTLQLRARRPQLLRVRCPLLVPCADRLLTDVSISRRVTFSLTAAQRASTCHLKVMPVTRARPHPPLTHLPPHNQTLALSQSQVPQHGGHQPAIQSDARNQGARPHAPGGQRRSQVALRPQNVCAGGRSARAGA